jgi:hypothetical protein
MSFLTQQRARITTVQIGIVVMTLLTAVAHLYLGTHPDESLRFWFTMNGLGYLALLAAFLFTLAAPIHKIVLWVLLGYAVLTIILWFFLGGISQGQIDPFDVTVKAIEVILVVLLLLDWRRSATVKGSY